MLYGRSRVNRNRRAVLRYGAALALVNLTGGTAAAAQGKSARILVLGDSLTAGYDLPSSQSFAAQLETALRAEGRDVTVINAGVSGDTTAGGKARLDWALAAKPDYAILELGGNDGLRGLDPKLTKANLDFILRRLKAEGIPTLLAGMLAPPNYGKAFEAEFKAVFSSLAAEHDVVFYPFFLDGAAGHPALTQPDGLHPTAKGVEIVVGRILPSVRTLLERKRP